MEILKHGNTVMHERCPMCECEFLYDKKQDIKLHSIPYSGPLPSGKAHELAKQVYWYVVCPDCGNEIKV
jgi:predicted RNA-binding Zn-ribbon protein involved in translation (DUF1610 family)